MSAKATRDSFGETLLALGKEDKRIVVLDADLSASTKSGIFGKAIPERFFQMGIAEANMVGTAAGMSFTGLIPFICSFGAFLTGRYDTIRISIGYSKANVKLVGTHAGLGIGDDGYTQMGLEDLSLMRGLPGFTVLQPCDHVTTVAAVRFAASHEGPVYLRLTRQKLPQVHTSESAFKMGQGIVLKEGGKVALLASGATVTEALGASLDLEPCWVVDFPTIKPIDRNLIRTLAQKCQLIATVEDHSVVGGLGSAVAEVLAEEGFAGKLVRLGLQDRYAESGEAPALYEKYGISSAKITASVRAKLASL